jgi:xanthine dehydrogenase accessory factor
MNSARLDARADVRLDTSLEMLLEHSPASPMPRVLATVVVTAGSTYRKPGARMLIMADGSHLGLLSGGCLEADLKLHAQQVLESGVARAVEYDMRGPDDVLFGIGAGCEGAMRVLLEPAHPGSRAADALAAAGHAVQSARPASLVSIHEFADLPLGTYVAAPPLPSLLIDAAAQAEADNASRNMDWQDGGRRRAFVQFLAPPPHLLICGAGPDAQPVARTARSLGWRVTVVDHRPAFVVAGDFPGAGVRLCDPRLLRSAVALESCHAAVVMSHHLVSDAAYLRELACADAPAYIGLLGPEARRTRLKQEFAPAIAEVLKLRLRGPVGIDIGAVTPEGIALAIVSQVHAWLAGRPLARL